MRTIELTQSKIAFVDDEMHDVLNARKWYAYWTGNNWYAGRSTPRAAHVDGETRQDKMHWYVVGHPLKGYVVDHINGNGLDNRRVNLRLVSSRANCSNKAANRRGKLVGCYFHKATGKWMARARVGTKNIYLGLDKTERRAHNRYIRFLKENNL